MRTTIFLALVALALPATADAACDCDDPTFSEATNPEFVVWARGTQNWPGRFGERYMKFDVWKPIRPKGITGMQLPVVVPPTCQLNIPLDVPYLVEAYPCGKTFCTSSCTNTRPLARPPGPTDRAATGTPLRNADASRLQRRAKDAFKRCSKEPDQPKIETFMISKGVDDDPLVEVTHGEPGDIGCVAEAVLQDVVPIDGGVTVSGSAIISDSPITSVELWKCGEAPWACDSFYAVVLDMLFNVTVPMDEAQARLVAADLHDLDEKDPSVEIAGTLCRIEGVEKAKAFADERRLVGGERWQIDRDRMLFRCAIALGDWDSARSFVATAQEGKLATLIVEWASAHSNPTLPLSDRTVPFAPGEWSSRGDLVRLRQRFAHDHGWANDPAWLEAFAETVIADTNPPARVKHLAALAYHKAALFAPSAAESYKALARAIAPDDEIADPLAKLTVNFAAQLDANRERAAASEKAVADRARAAALAPGPPQPIGLAEVEPDPEEPTNWGAIIAALIAAAIVITTIIVMARSASAEDEGATPAPGPDEDPVVSDEEE